MTVKLPIFSPTSLLLPDFVIGTVEVPDIPIYNDPWLKPTFKHNLYSGNKNDSDYITGIDLSGDEPNLYMYKNLNASPKIRKKMVKYFYYKFLDKWIYSSDDVLNFFVIQDGKVKMIDNLSMYSPQNSMKDTKIETEKKINYLEKHIFTKKLVYKILKKFVKKADTEWVKLAKSNKEYYVRMAIEKSLMKMLREIIKNRK